MAGISRLSSLALVPKLQLGIRGRMIAVLLGSLALFAVVVLVFGDAITGPVVRRQLTFSTERAKDFVEQSILERAALQERTVRALANQSVLRAAMSSNDPGTIAQAFGTETNRFGITEFEIRDATGRLIGGNGPEIPVTAPTVSQNHSCSMIEKFDGKYFLSAFVWVYDYDSGSVFADEHAKESIVGSIRIRTPLDQGWSDSLNRATNSEVAFVWNDSVIARTAGITMSDALYLSHHHTAGATESRVHGADFLYAIAKSPFDLQVLIARDVNNAMPGWRTARRAIACVALVAMILSVFIGMALSRSITQPLSMFVRAADAVRHGSWPEPLPKSGPTEIEFLADTFNEMVQSLRAQEEKLLALAYVDPLTDLYNHRYFQDRLIEKVTSGSSCGLIMIDCDNFHRYNERHGHKMGDEALVKIANVIARHISNGVDACRYGGEQFAVLLTDCLPARAQAVAEAIRSGVQTEMSDVELTVSAGTGMFPADTSSHQGLLMAAELALLHSKNSGRNCVTSYSEVPAATTLEDPANLYSTLRSGDLTTITALAAAVDAKDNYTHGHSANVSRLSVMLGQALGMESQELERLRMSALMHDVGKIGVPDAVLKKDGKLTDEEFEQMKTHTTIGHAIAMQANLNHLAAGIRSHHERWDGKGYPDRAAGDKIPFMARIIGLADSFDAMTSDRCYRKAPGIDFALEQIEKGIGLQFDPELAPVFIQLIREREDIQQAA